MKAVALCFFLLKTFLDPIFFFFQPLQLMFNISIILLDKSVNVLSNFSDRGLYFNFPLLCITGFSLLHASKKIKYMHT